VNVKKSQILKPLEAEPSRRHDDRARSHRRLRARDVEALRRLLDDGPLTIPQAYDCGHADNETTGHGMNRLVAAALVVFYGWNKADEDALWMITQRGRRALDARTRQLVPPAHQAQTPSAGPMDG
jgi:hypothetical protein